MLCNNVLTSYQCWLLISRVYRVVFVGNFPSSNKFIFPFNSSMDSFLVPSIGVIIPNRSADPRLCTNITACWAAERGVQLQRRPAAAVSSSSGVQQQWYPATMSSSGVQQQRCPAAAVSSSGGQRRCFRSFLLRSVAVIVGWTAASLERSDRGISRSAASNVPLEIGWAGQLSARCVGSRESLPTDQRPDPDDRCHSRLQECEPCFH